MLEEKIDHLNDRAYRIGNFAVQAMLYEVSCYPSPGLVSPISNGAHTDMNYFTFIDSTIALSRYFPVFAQQGFSKREDKEIFNEIRRIGIEAEKEMFAKTNGINTHKGMLFLMGISCAAVGKAIYEKKNFDEIKEIIKSMTAGLVEKELDPLKEHTSLSNGERLFLKYKTKGIRGEVEAGIPTVFDFAIDFYGSAKDLPMNDRLVHTLIGIMQICDDSTILHRHSPAVLLEVKEKAKIAVALGGMRTTEGKHRIHEMCNEFIERNISPGGSADLLAITVFFDLVKEYLLTINA